MCKHVEKSGKENAWKQGHVSICGPESSQRLSRPLGACLTNIHSAYLVVYSQAFFRSTPVSSFSNQTWMQFCSQLTPGTTQVCVKLLSLCLHGLPTLSWQTLHPKISSYVSCYTQSTQYRLSIMFKKYLSSRLCQDCYLACFEQQKKHPPFSGWVTKQQMGPKGLKPNTEQCGLQYTLDRVNPLLMKLNPKEM